MTYSRSRNSEGVLVRPQTVTPNMGACNGAGVGSGGCGMRHPLLCGGEWVVVADVRRRKISNAQYVGSYFESVECNAICLLDGVPADPELSGNFVIGVLCNAAHDDHEPAQYVKAMMEALRVLDKQQQVLSGKRRVL